MNQLVNCYEETIKATALKSFRVNLMTKFGRTTNNKGKRKEIKKQVANVYFDCGKVDLIDMTFKNAVYVNTILFVEHITR